VMRVVFFNPDGTVAAATDRMTLPPRGSMAASVDQLLGDAEWTAGSIEVFYAGPGVGRMFGSARHVTLNQADVQSLEHAGFKVFRGRSDK